MIFLFQHASLSSNSLTLPLSKAHMQISIRNCNSIDEAEITVQMNRLNIKYGPNGTGKSTIAKALLLSFQGEKELQQLLPFKHRAKLPSDATKSSVTTSDGLKSAHLFNEDYINQFVFTQDEVIKNSFDIFIKTPEYDKKMLDINSSISDIQSTFQKNEQIEIVLQDLRELHECFGKTAGLSKASKIVKGLGSGNRIEHIPAHLTGYTKHIKSEKNLSWLKWQLAGEDFLSISDDCPYCIHPTGETKDTILSIGKEYDAKSVEHLSKIQNILAKLGDYFSEIDRVRIDKIIKSNEPLHKEAEAYLITVKDQIELLIVKINDVRTISYFSLRDTGEIKAKIQSLTIDMDLINCLNSAPAKKIASEINASLENIILKAGALQGEVAKQNKFIKDTASKYNNEINTFLKFAGYKYYVDFVQNATIYQMKLKHIDHSNEIPHASTHLSFGERNAFSLVLFMYECLTKIPDLIILDDPISSFDKNKKFAIIEMLFRGKISLKNSTVIMLTHDIEPVVDMIKTLAANFDPRPVAAFLTNSKNILSEKPITKNDILSFTEVCERNIQNATHDILKTIYLRRNYEITGNKGLAYQLVSNVLHKRTIPLFRSKDANGQELMRNMTAAEVAQSQAEISVKIENFNYHALINEVNNKEAMKSLFYSVNNNYEKLQIFRIIDDSNHENSVIRKFVNETYHIENDYIMQLNPHEYDHVPEHIIMECLAHL
ncbi:AAA family ATPase [Massilia sp. DWR3-1-1]|uniref:AAA family ATPase n=1 Tax=Massilia sp. DWR3-1-1 TaxID=2804559 RepID=UPI003CFA494A